MITRLPTAPTDILPRAPHITFADINSGIVHDEPSKVGIIKDATRGFHLVRGFLMATTRTTNPPEWTGMVFVGSLRLSLFLSSLTMVRSLFLGFYALLGAASVLATSLESHALPTVLVGNTTRTRCNTVISDERMIAAEAHFAANKKVVSSSSLAPATVNVYFHVIREDETLEGGNIP
ncbi:hypothetical protein MPER_00777 [Moniliophthora perniciosa FA553]|nr:hypothetical protein MPER_00777 [Moniliophthora perniciosa FA553]